MKILSVASWGALLRACTLVASVLLPLHATATPYPVSILDGRAWDIEGAVKVYGINTSGFDRFTRNPNVATRADVRERYWRLVVFAPYFDRRLSWFPDALLHRNLYRAHGPALQPHRRGHCPQHHPARQPGRGADDAGLSLARSSFLLAAPSPAFATEVASPAVEVNVMSFIGNESCLLAD